jgi:hypothetical protein
MVLKPQIKRMVRRVRGYWHNRQLVRAKRVKAEDWVTESHANDNRIILMAIDALAWKIVDPLLDQGRLPHLKSLIERGSYAQPCLLSYGTLSVRVNCRESTASRGSWREIQRPEDSFHTRRI